MDDFQYLIVGGGLAGTSAARGIRDLDQNARIGMLCAEKHPPYKRPPLSKKLWMGMPFEKIWLDIQSLNLEIFLNSQAVGIDPVAHTVTDSSGLTFHYEKLLLATGISPRQLPQQELPIIYYRFLDDYDRLKGSLQPGGHVFIIGGGFIGSEMAAALRIQGQKVTMVFPENGICAKIFSDETSSYINNYYNEKGVNILSRTTITDIRWDGVFHLGYQDGAGRSEVVSADQVLAGIGSKPNTAIAEKIGITVSNGIDVDENLQTNVEDIFAAGDVANYPDPYLEKRRRIEHEDNAHAMGLQAGRNMAGALEKYNYLPYFYSDLFEIGYEAVGELDSRLEIHEFWLEKYKKGVVAYCDEGKIVGILLWDIFGKVDPAREIIKKKLPPEKKVLSQLLL